MTPTDPHHPRDPCDDGVVDAGNAESELHNADVAHEHSDVNVRALIISAIGLAGVVLFTFVAMWGLFGVLERQAAANDPQLAPVAVPAGQLPPAPRLLTNEPQALENLHASEAKLLDAYGWQDRDAGTVHIPIAEAKKLILQRGFTVRPDGPVDPAMGTRAPAMGEASSGRAIAVPRPPRPAAPAEETPGVEAKPRPGEGKG
jgi:hypothetical protein